MRSAVHMLKALSVESHGTVAINTRGVGDDWVEEAGDAVACQDGVNEERVRVGHDSQHYPCAPRHPQRICHVIGR